MPGWKPGIVNVKLVVFFRLLLPGAGSVYNASVAHIGVEVLQRAILGALCLVRLGAHLLVAAAIATVGGTDAAPFGDKKTPLRGVFFYL